RRPWKDDPKKPTLDSYSKHAQQFYVRELPAIFYLRTCLKKLQPRPNMRHKPVPTQIDSILLLTDMPGSEENLRRRFWLKTGNWRGVCLVFSHFCDGGYMKACFTIVKICCVMA